MNNLLHLAADVRMFGLLDDFSGFLFENHMTVVKRQIRKYDQPVQQVSKRFHEIAAADILNTEEMECSLLHDCHFNDPVIQLPAPIKHRYKEIKFNNFTINCYKIVDNNICLGESGAVEVHNIVECTNNDIFIARREYCAARKNVYENTDLDFLKISVIEYSANKVSSLSSWPLTAISHKAWKIRTRQANVVFFPLRL